MSHKVIFFVLFLEHHCCFYYAVGNSGTVIHSEQYTVAVVEVIVDYIYINIRLNYKNVPVADYLFVQRWQGVRKHIKLVIYSG